MISQHWASGTQTSPPNSRLATSGSLFIEIRTPQSAGVTFTLQCTRTSYSALYRQQCRYWHRAPNYADFIWRPERRWLFSIASHLTLFSISCSENSWKLCCVMMDTMMMRCHYWHRESMSSMLREISASSLTASRRCQHRFQPCVVLAITSSGSCVRLFDACLRTPPKSWSRLSSILGWITATRCTLALVW